MTDPPRTSRGPGFARIALLALAAMALLLGIAGGLARLGIAVPSPATAIAAHGALLVTGFLGTVIGLERAITVGGGLALAAPLAAAATTVALLFASSLGAMLAIVAPLPLVALSVVILRRQRALHTTLLLVAALAWLAANAAYALGRDLPAVTAGWLAFLVLTIAAERLELTRLTKRRPIAQPLFVAAVGLLVTGAIGIGVWPLRASYALYGVALVALAAWLAVFDVARRTVRMTGLPRYAAIALLAGYAWLALGGVAWALLPQTQTQAAAPRDVAIHAVAIGFVFSMIFAHAPIIVPVIARRGVRFSCAFYAPLALLHASLAVRLLCGAWDVAARQWGSALDAVAMLAFAAMMAFAVTRRAR